MNVFGVLTIGRKDIRRLNINYLKVEIPLSICFRMSDEQIDSDLMPKHMKPLSIKRKNELLSLCL